VKISCITAVLLLSCSLSFAGTPGTSADQQSTVRQQKDSNTQVPLSPLSTDVCAFNFSSGSNNTVLNYCVTQNGNVINVETPAGQHHIFSREGYGLCDINSNTEYFDYSDAGDTANWNPAIVLSHSATKVKIARTTSDGIWTLTQTITQVAPTSTVKVSMTIKNNTAVNREAQLSRFADIDADGTTPNTVDSTLNSAMIFNSVGRGGSFGLTLQNVGTSPFTYLGFIQNTPFRVSPCSPFTSQAIGPLVGTDGSAVMTYVIPVPKNASKTVNVSYRGL
jgi:Tfp pilus assembly protein PilW